MDLRRDVVRAAAAIVVAGTASGACADVPTAFGPPLDGRADAGAVLSRTCEDGRVVPAYPTGPYAFGIGETLPDERRDRVDARGEVAPYAFHDAFDACGTGETKVLVVRVTAAWCGTCRAHADVDAGLTEDLRARKAILVDFLVADEDDVPATIESASRYRAKASFPVPVVVDPGSRWFEVAFGGRALLPLYVIVDLATMKPLRFLADPDPLEVPWAVDAAIADRDGKPRPVAPESHAHDGRFASHHARMIAAMDATSLAPPPSPTNRVADDPVAARLGKALFSDADLSPSGVVACAHCHAPDAVFQDGQAQAVGVGKGVRNAPSIVLAAHARWQFWDGRADTAWSQALGPMENVVEMGSTRLFVAHRVAEAHATDYETVFGALPPLGDTSRFPASGKPGDAAWEAMTAPDRDAVDRVFVGVGKAIEAFERTLRTPPVPLDAYARDDLGALDDDAKDGLRAFFHAGCAQCHYGPRLTDDAFHPIRFPTGRDDGRPDEGRSLGLALLRESPFRGDGAFSDAKDARPLGPLVVPANAEGAMKTPSLRGVRDTAPYGHGGSIPDLEEVVRLYATSGLPEDDPRAVGRTEPWLVNFDEPTKRAIPAFLRTLRGSPAR
ncbi:MAG: cytochrome c peroxidase [Polyangiaceae bacterium]